jgi:hypothetical protein
MVAPANRAQCRSVFRARGIRASGFLVLRGKPGRPRAGDGCAREAGSTQFDLSAREGSARADSSLAQ